MSNERGLLYEYPLSRAHRVTALALMVLRDMPDAIPARLKGFDWLMNFAGREGNWLWKWKFRTADRHVRFDPKAYGTLCRLRRGGKFKLNARW